MAITQVASRQLKEIDPAFTAWLEASPLAGYVPYTGATTDVDLGAHSLTTKQIINVGSESKFINSERTISSRVLPSYESYLSQTMTWSGAGGTNGISYAAAYDQRTVSAATTNDHLSIYELFASKLQTSGALNNYLTVFPMTLYDLGTYNKATSQTVTNCIFDGILSLTPNVDCAGTNFTYNNFGNKLTINYEPDTAGMSAALTSKIYGQAFVAGSFSNVTGSTYYALYNDIDNLAANWFLYNNSSAHNWLGEDNTVSYIGTAQDSGFYYDGTNTIWKNYVGSGYFDLQMALKVTGAITSSALTSGRIPYASTNGLLVDSASLTYNGTGVGSGVASAIGKFEASYTGGYYGYVLRFSDATSYGSTTVFDDRNSGSYVFQYGIYGSNTGANTSNAFFYNTCGGGIGMYCGSGSPTLDLRLQATTTGGAFVNYNTGINDTGNLYYKNAISSGANLSWKAGGTTTTARIGHSLYTDTTTDGDLIFSTYTGGLNERMRIMGKGQVRIGSSSVYTAFSTDASGNLTASPTGGNFGFGVAATTTTAANFSKTFALAGATGERFGIQNRPTFTANIDQTTSVQYGMSNGVFIDGSYDFNIVYGQQAFLRHNGDANSNLANGQGFNIQVGIGANGGTATALTGINISSFKSSGTITTLYGLKIENLTHGGTNYSIYTGTAPSYFGGSVQLPDGVEMVYGTGSDCTISFDGTDWVFNATGIANVVTKFSTYGCEMTGYRNYLAIKATAADSACAVSVENDAQKWGFYVEGGDGDNLYIRNYTASTSPILVTPAGTIGLGNYNTNYTAFDSTGHQTMAGTAQAWEDLRIEPVARTTGTGAPAFEKYFDDAAGTSIGVYLYSFTNESVASNEKQMFFTMQMPHAWNGGAISMHVHWTPKESENAVDVLWGLEYAWKDIGETFGDTTIVTASTTYVPDDANLVAGKHYIAEFADLSPGTTADGLSSILIGRLFRNSSAAGDTCTKTAGLLYIDCHYQLNSLGSTDEYTK